MPLALLRVDDRLVHGQVVIGWGRPLGVKFIVLVDNDVRQSSWEQDLYRMAVPEEVELVFASTAEAIERISGWAADPRPGILLTADLATMLALHDAAPEIVRRVNLGGLHHRPGKVERLRYIYLADGDDGVLRRLAGGGTDVSAQDLPTTAAVGLEALLK